LHHVEKAIHLQSVMQAEHDLLQLLGLQQKILFLMVLMLHEYIIFEGQVVQVTYIFLFLKTTIPEDRIFCLQS